MAAKKPARRKRLVEAGGVEMFEVRIVYWFDQKGKRYISTEITTPEGPVEYTDPEHIGVMLQAAMDEAQRV